MLLEAGSQQGEPCGFDCGNQCDARLPVCAHERRRLRLSGIEQAACERYLARVNGIDVHGHLGSIGDRERMRHPTCSAMLRFCSGRRSQLNLRKMFPECVVGLA